MHWLVWYGMHCNTIVYHSIGCILFDVQSIDYCKTGTFQTLVKQEYPTHSGVTPEKSFFYKRSKLRLNLFQQYFKCFIRSYIVIVSVHYVRKNAFNVLHDIPHSSV